MLVKLFRSDVKAERDEREVRILRSQYGNDLMPILRERANNKDLRPRDRRHWRRILRRAGQFT